MLSIELRLLGTVSFSSSRPRRGGGTNVHPGNRTFRDLINLHRRAYLKARKNDKPAISRAIVRQIRENNGRFLKKDEKSGLWFEIGDDAAREKTSQALRQRAPEMRKLLFDTEREEARALAEEQMRQHRMMMMPPPGMTPEMMANMPQMPMGPGGMPMFPPFFAQMQAQQGKQGNGKNEGGENGQHPPMPPFPMFPFMGGPVPFPPPPANGAPGKSNFRLCYASWSGSLAILIFVNLFFIAPQPPQQEEDKPAKEEVKASEV